MSMLHSGTTREREKSEPRSVKEPALLQSQGCIDFLRASGQLAVSDQRLSL